MKKLDYAMVKNKGEKIEEFSRLFLNRMASADVKMEEKETPPNEIKIEMSTSHYTKGEFHAINDSGDLYYKAYIKDDNLGFWGNFLKLLLLAIVIGIPGSIYIGPYMLAGFVIPLCWCMYGNYLQYGDEPEKSLLPFALRDAESKI